MLLSYNCCGEKVVRLVPWGFGVPKRKCGDKFRQDTQLLNQIIIELSPALIRGKHFLAFRWRPQAVPADDNRAGVLVGVEAQQEVREAKDSARRLAVAAAVLGCQPRFGLSILWPRKRNFAGRDWPGEFRRRAREKGPEFGSQTALRLANLRELRGFLST
jgi:hypothetical protein